MAVTSRNKYPLLFWRPFFDIGICYVTIAAAIYLCHLSIYFYPLSILIIANRILALSLLSHEAIHGSLFTNHRVNNFFGRWFCAFPTCISFSKYRKLHLLHHRALGNTTYDPDFGLYKEYPIQISTYLGQNLKDLLTLKTLRKFIDYYTEINDVFFSKESIVSKIKKNRVNGDFVEFVFFNMILFFVLFYYDIFHLYFFFLLIPLLFITQPYVLLMGGLQHGPFEKNPSVLMLSRSVRGSKWFMEMVLPLDINYHSEHHYNSSVPHYWLKKYSKDLEDNQQQIWSSNYPSALNQLFGVGK